MSLGYAYDLHLESADLTGAASVQYFSTHGLATGAAYLPADTYLDGRILDLTLPPRRLFAGRATRGGKPIGTGEVVLSNADGGLDDWIDRAFDGYSALVYRTPVALHGDIAEATLVFTGTVEGVEVDEARAVVKLRDVVHQLNRPVITQRFAGNNSLPNGLEGVGDDIKGRVKPWVLGVIYNWRPPLVNTSRLIYQLSCRQLSISVLSGLDVYDAGVELTAGLSIALAKMQAGATGPYACTFAAGTAVTVTAHGFTTGDPINFTTTGTLPAEVNESAYYYARNTGVNSITVHTSSANAIANLAAINFSGAGTGTHDVAHNRTIAGAYDYTNDATAGFYVRLGATPTGDVTVDMVTSSGSGSSSGQVQPAYSSGISTTIAMQLYELRVLAGDLPASGYYVQCLAECRLDAGVVVDDEITYVELLDRYAASAGAGWYFDAGLDSKLVIKAIDDTVGSSTFAVGEGDVLGTVRVGVADDDERGVPPWRANVRFLRNHLLQRAADVPGASETRRAFVEREYRIRKYEDTDVQAIWPNAPELDIITVLTDGGEAEDLATELQIRYAPNGGEYVRHVVELTVPVAAVDGIDVLDTVTLTHSRFGYGAGKNLQVLALQESLNGDGVAVCQLMLWG